MGRKIIMQKSNKHETLGEKLKAEARAEILENIEEETNKIREEAEREIRNKKREAEEEIKNMRREAEEEISDMRREAEEEIRKMRTETEEEIDDERRKNMQETRERREEVNKIVSETDQKIGAINEQIQMANLKTAEYQMLQEENKALKKKLEKYRTEIELLKEQSLNPNANRENQENITDIEKSIFDIVKQEPPTKIGQIVLSEELSSKQFQELAKRCKAEQVHKDGILLENGFKISIMAIPSEKEKNKYEFYSNIPIITRYNLLGITNFIFQLHKIGIKPAKEKESDGISLDCVLYDDEKKIDENYISKETKPNIYRIKYKNGKFENYGLLALTMHKNLNCSKKNVSINRLKQVSARAFVESAKLSGNSEFINEVDKKTEFNER